MLRQVQPCSRWPAENINGKKRIKMLVKVPDGDRQLACSNPLPGGEGTIRAFEHLGQQVIPTLGERQLDYRRWVLRVRGETRPQAPAPRHLHRFNRAFR